MRNKLPVLILSVGLALVLLAATLLYEEFVDRERLSQVATLPNYTPPTSATDDTADATDPTQADAPDFTVYDAEGQPHTLEEYRGKPVVINFWASWCDPCTKEMPMFQSAYDAYKDDVHFLMINMTDGARETKESADKLIADNGYTFPVYYDTDSTAAINYDVMTVPTTYFVDANGKAIA
jgi:thiol-disulfide isomerase/thioredoxin